MHNGLTVFLGGDVMTGRGIDQILPHPGDPRLWEPQMRDARDYVELAERAHGPIQRPVDPAWPWGDASRLLDEAAPDVRLLNLETSVTRSDDAEAGKAVHYRMNPDNVDCLAIARPDACALANNHVLDFGPRGLEETLDTLRATGIRTAGAGRDADEAAEPVPLPVADGHRVWIFSVGSESSGIPPTWSAGADGPGIDLLPDLGGATAAALTERVRRAKGPGDLAVVSIHWGTNWGYHVPTTHTRFARRLIDGGVDLVYGHSAHHPRPIEVYRRKLILYGCGDLIDDYEGITDNQQQYRDDLRLLYLATLSPDQGGLSCLRIIPLQAHQMRLRRACDADVGYLRRVLNRISRRAPTIEIDADGMLAMRPAV